MKIFVGAPVSTPANFISEESLINVVYDKNTIKESFSFRNCQEPERREMTECSSDAARHMSKMAAQTHSQGINQQKCVRLFRYSDWLSRYPHLKLE